MLQSRRQTMTLTSRQTNLPPSSSIRAQRVLCPPLLRTKRSSPLNGSPVTSTSLPLLLRILCLVIPSCLQPKTAVVRRVPAVAKLLHPPRTTNPRRTTALPTVMQTPTPTRPPRVAHALQTPLKIVHLRGPLTSSLTTSLSLPVLPTPTLRELLSRVTFQGRQASNPLTQKQRDIQPTRREVLNLAAIVHRNFALLTAAIMVVTREWK